MPLLCVRLLVAVVLLAPAGVAISWSKSRSRPFPLATVGASLMLISFGVLPWLSLQPLDPIGLEWLGDALPMAGRLLALLGAKSLSAVLGWMGVIGFLTNWYGWVALLLTAGPPVWVAATLLGVVALGAAWAVGVGRQKPAAYVLLAAAAALVLLVAYSLPLIDGLGEHPFPHPLTVTLPFLGARLNWLGPGVMFVALGLLMGDALLTLRPSVVSLEDEGWE